MSKEVRNAALKEKTKSLLEGPLKHIRGAALAAALLPLASVAAAPAAAQDVCGSGSGGCVGGSAWSDANNYGLQDTGETSLSGVTVFLCEPAVTSCDSTNALSTTQTNDQGFYFFEVPNGTYTVSVQIPQGTQPSPDNVGGDDTVDSDGKDNTLGYSVATVTISGVGNTTIDFGFMTSEVLNPGTGTPGYWKNHPEAWPVSKITVGGVEYTVDQAIALLGKVGKDKTLTMFSSLVSAMLNVMIGNDSSCVYSTITAANTWMATYGPPGSNVAASSYAWSMGEPLHRQMDDYNNGRICAPHRN